jgi:hypothetical protein
MQHRQAVGPANEWKPVAPRQRVKQRLGPDVLMEIHLPMLLAINHGNPIEFIQNT